ncbi:unnamed protein product, partial [marine sediment metagenome]
GLFILAMISILWIIKTKNVNEFRLAVILICIVFAIKTNINDCGSRK